jgi:hypothetical protein
MSIVRIPVSPTLGKSFVSEYKVTKDKWHEMSRPVARQTHIATSTPQSEGIYFTDFMRLQSMDRGDNSKMTAEEASLVSTILLEWCLTNYTHSTFRKSPIRRIRGSEKQPTYSSWSRWYLPKPYLLCAFRCHEEIRTEILFLYEYVSKSTDVPLWSDWKM